MPQVWPKLSCESEGGPLAMHRVQSVLVVWQGRQGGEMPCR